MSLRQTPFHSHHSAAGAKLIDFGGWEMPLQYVGIIAEHKRVRSAVGLFDVSHMGELRVVGPQALAAVRYLVTNDVEIVDGQAQYTCMCKPDGGVVDDLIVYRVSETDILLCVNASNQEKDYAWAKSQLEGRFDVSVTDQSADWAQVAIQGRGAVATLGALTDCDLTAIKYFWFAQATVAGVEGCIIARTGYTGEDGFEVFIPAAEAAPVWPAILAAGEAHGIGPIGLGARDTLRLEARLHLYGNDMDESTTALQAALGWCTKLRGDDFIGRDAMRQQRKDGLGKRLVGMTVTGRIPRPHCAIVSDGETVGEVTSGTRSPTLGSGIALGYVPTSLAKPGTTFQIDVRGRTAEAVVVRGPFYKRDY